MTKQKILFIALTLIILWSKTYAQNNNQTCESDEDDLFDLNSITKCTVKEPVGEDKKRKVSFQVTSRRRLNRKRNKAESISSIDPHKVADIKNTNSIANKLSLKEIDNSGLISFYKVDEIPLFKACEKSPIHDQQKCFRKQMTRHVKLNLQYPQNSYKKGIQGRVLANLVIDKNGKANIKNTLFPYKGEELREEAIRIIKKLPAFIPGKQANNPVNIQYSLRVVFNIPGIEKTNIRKEIINNEKIYEFQQVDKIPEFKNCSNKTNNLSNCFTKELQQHVMNNFAYPIVAVNNDIQGSVIVKFVIDREGSVANISAKGQNNTAILEQAAKRLVQKLPTFKPAMKNGIAVTTVYEFPIIFSLED